MTRPMVSVGIPFLATALVVSFFPRNIALILALVLGIALVPSCFLPRRIRLRVIVVLASGLAACAVWAGYAQSRVVPEALHPGHRVLLQGEVEEIEQRSGGRATLTLRIREVVDKDGTPLPGMLKSYRALVYLYEETDLDYYDIVQVEGRILRPGNTPSFDYARYLQGMKIELVISASKLTADPPQHRPLLYWVKTFRSELLERVDNVLGRPTAGLIKAMLLGYDADIDPLIYKWFQISGITHIFVVSGLHLSLMSGGVFWLLKRIRGLGRTAPLLALTVVWLFAGLTGFGLATIRSAVMMSVLFVGRLFHRPSDAVNSLFLAGVGIVLWNPAAILSGSFQLSFMATLGTITLATPIQEKMLRLLRLTSRLGRGVCGMTALSVGSNLAMLPVIWSLFQGVSLVSPLTNLVAVPLLPILLILSVILLLVSPIRLFSSAVAKLIELGIDIICWSAELLSGSTFSYLGLDAPFVVWWLILGAGLFLVAILWRKRVPKAPVIAALLLLVVTAALFGVWNACNRDRIEIVPIVGYDGGTVAILHDGGATVVSFADDSNVAEQTESFLRQKNVRFIDDLIVFSADTREPSGLRLLAECCPVYHFFLSEENSFASAADTVSVAADTHLVQQGHGFEIFSFAGGKCELRRTEKGMYLLLEAGGTRVCMTDSAEIAWEMNCEILIFGGETDEFRGHPTAKCVILIKEPDSVGETLPDEAVEAYREEVSLRLRQNGDWTI